MSDRSPHDPENDPGAYEAGFDDQPIDDPELYEEPAGFDDEPIDYDAYADAGAAPKPLFGGHEYDSEGARQLRTESLRRVRGGSGGAIAVGMIALLMLGAIPVLAIAVFVLSQKEDRDEDRSEIVEAGDGRVIVKTPGPPPKIEWVEVAEGEGQNLGGVAVRLTQIAVGKARARDAGNRVVFTGNDYLRIGLRVESFREAPFEYVSWYGREVEQFSGRDRVRLYDESGAELAPHVFAEVQDLEGHTPRATLDTRDEVRDMLYFDLPEGKTVQELGDLRLTIPFDSRRSDQKYGFLIANELIVEQDDSSVDPTTPLSAEDLEALTADEEMDDEEPAP